MKLLNKIAKLMIAFLMTLSMGVTAFAEGETTSGYTISVASGDTHTYSVYQVLTGDLTSTTTDGNTVTKLSNVVAGSNFKTVDNKSAETVAEELASTQLTGQALANEIAKYVNFKGNAYATVSANSPKTGVPAGYYLIKDNGATDMTNDSYSTYIVKVVGDVTITPKKDTPTFEKKIKDTNDTTGDTSGWQDSADYDIGDAVPFQLTGTLPTNYDSYTTYYYEFSDQMEKGLTFNKDSVKVYVVNGEQKTKVTSGFTVSDGATISTTDTFNEGTAFTVTFSNLKGIKDSNNNPLVNSSSKIVVEYTATLNEHAVLGSTGNVNEAKLIYSNNPNNSGEGHSDHGETPWDNVIIFTYKVVVNKVDQDGYKLAGAAFKLEKEIKATTEGAQNTWTTVTEFTAGDATSFTFSGLDDGNYRLTETTTPAGYNTIDPITFTVTAVHDVEWTAGARTGVLTSLSGAKTENLQYTGEITFTSDVSKSSLTTNVVNKAGSTLPETGGIGTTIFYVVGGVLMIGAGLLLVKNKKTNN